MKKEVCEVVYNFFEDIYFCTKRKIKNNKARNIGERLALPKKYY